MTITVLLAAFMMVAEPPSAPAQDSTAHLEAEISRLRGELDQQRGAYYDMAQKADDLSRKLNEAETRQPCDATLQLERVSAQKAQMRNDASVDVEVFAMSNCKAEIRIVASYVDATGEAVCTGTVEQL